MAVGPAAACQTSFDSMYHSPIVDIDAIIVTFELVPTPHGPALAKVHLSQPRRPML
jgi:hypothetical protein